ncbi:M14 family zinc carboxypeptidase [Fervidibacillus halotolerans]|uniref:M14 family zinc carboxypeptidase n=1 Tax=Fervidibacillus halotolerans TaxID=2980027 RepID=A0A9E8M070_9BACI|nr:M14 family zinc carboxypeptidase [Fervidibacillus halotolerans]WAA12970.1 M14 family zinc carboxypeptidase [Fervidibacillus halotolerans]
MMNFFSLKMFTAIKMLIVYFYQYINRKMEQDDEWMKKKTYIFIICLCFQWIFVKGVFAFHVIGENPYDSNALEKDLIELKKEYGKVVEISSIGKSHFGKNIWSLRIGKGKEAILFIGAHHGREWITANLLMVMAERYAYAYKERICFGKYNPNLLDEISIVFIPMVNPDGIDIQQGRIPKENYTHYVQMNGGSKDFSRWKANGVGIDLNRQYPAGWEQMKSPPKPSFQFYKGSQPLQAKEARAIVQFVNQLKPLATVSYHSSGREIYWKYGKGDYSLAVKLANLTGYSLADPPVHAVGAGFTDWFIHAYQRPGFTLEICKPVNNRHPPIEELVEEWERNRYVGFLLVDEIRKRGHKTNK